MMKGIYVTIVYFSHISLIISIKKSLTGKTIQKSI